MTSKGTRARGRVLALSILFAFVCVSAAPAAALERPADTVFTDGFIYTADSLHSVAQAIAVRDGEIIFVGSNSGAKAFVGPKTVVASLGAKMVLPGFTDAHCHADAGGIQALCEISFPDENTSTIQGYLQRIADFVKASPDLPGYRGMGWLNGAAPGIGPLAADLDRIVRDRPVVLRSQDGHSVWVNSKALQLAHITKETPDPPNGKIERLPDGRPSGTLRGRSPPRDSPGGSPPGPLPSPRSGRGRPGPPPRSGR